MKKQNKTIEQTIKTTFSAGIFFLRECFDTLKNKKIVICFFLQMELKNTQHILQKDEKKKYYYYY
jgi:hypothetical protein